MARQESDRENLLDDATAFAERVELSVAAFDENVFVGFRSDGCGSVYFGQDPVYQFNSSGQLRRVFRDSLMLVAEYGNLVSLDRQRTDDEVQLLRRDLSDKETQAQVDQMHAHLQKLRAALGDGQFQVVGQVPTDADLVGRVDRWLGEVADAGVARITNAT